MRATLRAFALMEAYGDHPMDLADGSIIAAAEALGIRKVFTPDPNDVETYGIKRGRRFYPVDMSDQNCRPRCNAQILRASLARPPASHLPRSPGQS